MNSGLLTNLRLWSGLILYTFVTSHLVNHGLGILSLDAMETGREIFTAIWRNPLGTLLIYGALFTHLILVLLSLAKRRTLKMPPYEALQVIFGLVFPLVLMTHVIGTRVNHEIFGTKDTYAFVLASLWVFDPKQGVLQAVMLTLAWLHGTIGLYLWLRLKTWFNRVVSWAYACAIILPILALFGYVNGGRTVAIRFEDGTYVPPNLESDQIEFLYNLVYVSIAGYVALICIAILWRVGRWVKQRRAEMVRITYPDGQRVSVEPGTSVLEASRRAGIPHASICGGRGRCSTCRIHVSYGREDLPAPSAEEIRVLQRVGASGNTRLACQLKPTRDLTVTPLLPPDSSMRAAKKQHGYQNGAEQEIAILFADIRSFTAIAEKKLPYDVVFVLNQYFRTVGQAIEHTGGRIDKFIGDGVMALFGVQQSPKEACFSALEAARYMAEGIDKLNDHLKADLEKPIRIGIGIHIGSVIVGDIGYANSRSITAIGDAVNTASRLENLNKTFKSQLLVSEKVVKYAGGNLNDFKREKVNIPGRSEPLSVCIVSDAKTMQRIN